MTKIVGLHKGAALITPVTRVSVGGAFTSVPWTQYPCFECECCEPRGVPLLDVVLRDSVDYRTSTSLEGIMQQERRSAEDVIRGLDTTSARIRALAEANY